MNKKKIYKNICNDTESTKVELALVTEETESNHKRGFLNWISSFFNSCGMTIDDWERFESHKYKRSSYQNDQPHKERF